MFNEFKKIHFIGIGGIGVSAVAKFFLDLGKEVTGSDAAESENTASLEKLGAKIFIGHNENNLSDSTDLVVYSPAVPEENPEFLRAKLLGKTLKTYPEMLGILMEKFSETVAVSGTNGKTTTSAITGLIMEAADLDPTVILGGKVSKWGGNIRIGKEKKYFLAEACEYKRSMMSLCPKNIILTNIEEDHLDYYKDLEDIKSAFRDYVKKLPSLGCLVYNADDEASLEISDTVFLGVKKLSYSINKENKSADLIARDIFQGNGKQSFRLVFRGEDLGDFEIFIPGIFNIYNALAASLFALNMGIRAETIKEVLKKFRGTWRRFEILGEPRGAIIISDYAHHPTAVKETISGAKKFYPGKKLLAVFEPHQKDRTIKLFDKFTESFIEADEAIISEIYSVQGRNQSEREISSLDLVEAIKKKYSSFKISYSKDLEETKKMILEKISDFGIVLIMGAGNIYKIAEELVRN